MAAALFGNLEQTNCGGVERAINNWCLTEGFKHYLQLF